MKLRGGDARWRSERAVIERQAAHLTRLVDDLLDVSRITRGKVELRAAAAGSVARWSRAPSRWSAHCSRSASTG